MLTPDRARVAGLICLAGGLFWVLSLLQTGAGSTTPRPLMLLFALANLCLMAGPLALRALQAAGAGWTGRVGAVGMAIALLGQLAYIVGAGYIATHPADEFTQPFTPLGAVLVGLGMLLLGLAAARARRLAGWRAFAPLLVGAFYWLMIPVQVVAFIGPTGQPSYKLLAAWGLCWMLLGYAIWTRATRPAAPALA